jgi:catechol 2,3-dioxygenase-like lactoylglutathione lyase family enzyme
MTWMNGFIAPSRRPGELGVHSLDHFSITVPDLAEAQKFYQSFGLELDEQGANIGLSTASQDHQWGLLTEGEKKSLRYISFGAFEDDFDGFRRRLENHGIRRLDPPPGIETDGLWFRDPDGILLEIRVCEKSSPNEKLIFNYTSVPAGMRGVLGRSGAGPVRPRRMSHVLVFTTDVGRAIRFYHEIVGLRLSDRSGEFVAFMHGIHGSDHHMLAFAKSSSPGFHHVSWNVDSIDQVGLGAMQMADHGFSAGWGTGRHVLGSNFFFYVRDPWGSYSEYACDIDYIAADQDWEALDHKPEDAVYLWGPALPEDFVVNYEAQAESASSLTAARR